MKNLYRNIYIHGLIFSSLLNVAGCNLANIKAEEKSANSNPVRVEAGTTNDEKKSSQNSFNDSEPQITSASVAGTYEYDTHKDGEGYDNELDIKDAGNGKLYVFLSGSYIYKVGETQSFHEAEGKGDAQLQRGDTANAILVDEEGKPCRATITFKKDEAAVKIPDTCRFNISLGGIYKRAAAKSIEKKASQPSTVSEISYRELMNFVNDFDNHRPGERFVVTGVPANKIEKITRADEFGNTSYKNLFYLEANNDDGYTGSSLLTSKAMLESITREVEYEPATLRLNAVLIESNGKFDVYRMSFVTKIEGLNDDGSVIWTATGGEPAKTKFTH